MIFKEILLKQEPLVRVAVEELFNAAEKNQNHPQDILLIREHCHYNDSIPDHVLIGPMGIGFSMESQYKFYDWYRKAHVVSKEDLGNGKISLESEEISVQIEKLIYLKFWESDMILKYLYQLVNSANGQPYDWNLKIPERKRHEFIRKKIRDRAKIVCPNFYSLMKDTYSSQIRNAIAHSQFYFGTRRICYLNYSQDPQKYCPIPSLSFDEWAVYSCNTILLYNEMIKNFKRMGKHYIEKEKQNGFLEINGSASIIKLCYNSQNNTWVDWMSST